MVSYDQSWLAEKAVASGHIRPGQTLGILSVKMPSRKSLLPTPSSICSAHQRELPQEEPTLPSFNESAPHSGGSPRKGLLPPSSSMNQPHAGGAPPERASSSQKLAPPSFNRAAPRSGRSPRNSLLPPYIEQPHAAGAPPKQLHPSSKPRPLQRSQTSMEISCPFQTQSPGRPTKNQAAGYASPGSPTA